MTSVTTMAPGPGESELAAVALRELAAGSASLSLAGSQTDVPRAAVEALRQVLESFARGDSVSIVPSSAELTTQQAAEMLNVSRPFLISLLDAGDIAYRRVGTHRRIQAASLIRYLQLDDAQRREAADALSSETHKLGFA